MAVLSNRMHVEVMSFFRLRLSSAAALLQLMVAGGTGWNEP